LPPPLTRDHLNPAIIVLLPLMSVLISVTKHGTASPPRLYPYIFARGNPKWKVMAQQRIRTGVAHIGENSSPSQTTLEKSGGGVCLG
jgi:hypothetical protein